MVERLSGSHAKSACQVARETGVSQQSLSRWLREARSLPDVATSKRSSSKVWTIDEKVRVLATASTVSGEELSQLLEREGLVLAELERWRLALGEDPRGTVATTKRIRTLERELARKEKALAEAAALLILKKKADLLWGAGDDDTDDNSEK
jgi:transposase